MDDVENHIKARSLTRAEKIHAIDLGRGCVAATNLPLRDEMLAFLDILVSQAEPNESERGLRCGDWEVGLAMLKEKAYEDTMEKAEDEDETH
jgi:hypothetical protein